MLKLALFDLDGTLTPMDTQLLFRHFVLKRSPWRVVLIVPFLWMVPLKILRLVSTRTMKRAFLSYLWRLRSEAVEMWAGEFAREVGERLIFSEIRERLEDLRNRGVRCVLNTASPDIYAVPLGRVLGFEEIFATTLKHVERYSFFPDLEGPNNKGEAKMQRMEHFLPRQRPIPGCVVFTDSVADLPMLQAATLAVLVSPGAGLSAQILPKAEVEVVEPKMPWPGRRPGLWVWVRLLLGLGERPCFRSGWM